MDFFDQVGGFFKDIAPIIGAGTSIYQNYQQGSSRDDYLNSLREREQANYDRQKEQYDAYVNYLGQRDAVAQANAAASAAAANARAAAARQQEKNRMRAARKANKLNKRFAEQQMALFEPYQQAGVRLLPQAEQAYSTGLNGLHLLNAYLNQPAQMAKMDAPAPALAVAPMLGGDLRGGS